MMTISDEELYSDLLYGQKMLNENYSVHKHYIWTLKPFLRLVDHIDVDWTGIPDKLNINTILTAIRKAKEVIQNKLLPSYIKIWRQNVGTVDKFMGPHSGVIRCKFILLNEYHSKQHNFTVLNEYNFTKTYKINQDILFNVEFSDFERKWIAINVNKY
jgi:hypothetical protein